MVFSVLALSEDLYKLNTTPRVQTPLKNDEGYSNDDDDDSDINYAGNDNDDDDDDINYAAGSSGNKQSWQFS